jgi:hypothetical protein
MAPSFASMDGVAWPFVDSFRLVDQPDDQTTQYKRVYREQSANPEALLPVCPSLAR